MLWPGAYRYSVWTACKLYGATSASQQSLCILLICYGQWSWWRMKHRRRGTRRSAASTHTAIATRHTDLRYAVGAVKPCHRALGCTGDGNPGDVIPPGATRDTTPRTQKQGNSIQIGSESGSIQNCFLSVIQSVMCSCVFMCWIRYYCMFRTYFYVLGKHIF